MTYGRNGLSGWKNKRLTCSTRSVIESLDSDLPLDLRPGGVEFEGGAFSFETQKNAREMWEEWEV